MLKGNFLKTFKGFCKYQELIQYNTKQCQMPLDGRYFCDFRKKYVVETQ